MDSDQILEFMAGPENSMLKWDKESDWAEPMLDLDMGLRAIEIGDACAGTLMVRMWILSDSSTM